MSLQAKHDTVKHILQIILSWYFYLYNKRANLQAIIMNSEEEIELRKKIFREFASKGGKARARKLSPAKRKEIASKAAKAMWKKKRKK